MIRKFCVTLSVIMLLLTSIGYAGKPYRKPMEDLANRADIILIGQVVSLHPSLLKNVRGHPQAVAEVSIFETLKGDDWNLQDKKVYVVTDYRGQTLFDEKGKIIRLSTAWRYWMEPGTQKYILFLKGKKEEGPFQVFRPLDHGSGIMKFTEDKNSVSNKYLIRLRKILNRRNDKK